VILPNLLYLSNVPVEASYHGSALLCRLLSDYPPDKLRILEGTLPHGSQPERRLKGVEYGLFPSGVRQFLRSRLYMPYGSWLSWRAASWWRKVDRYCGEFRPEAVLTVAHGPLWFTAAAYARHRGLPLHLICHDEIGGTVPLHPRFRPWLEAQFGAVYRQAASRLCVSPYMEKDYHHRFGAAGTILYPARSDRSLAFDHPPDRLGQPLSGLTVAFGGTINGSGHLAVLKNLALALQRVGGRLLIFGPWDDPHNHRAGLDLPNVELRGLMTSPKMISALREEADALVVPMSFAAGDSQAMRTNFPSKLADYTAAGLPLLIIGPPDSSAVVWAKENAPVAEVVTELGAEPLLPALRRFKEDDAHRVALAEAAIRVGETFFAPERAREIFLGAIAAAHD
jgi:glycosyltransferase involved in cell wall biosynthesis